jgi:hypothetical protein
MKLSSVLRFKLEVRLPLEDEPFVRAWDRYAIDSRTAGVFAALQRRIVQLRFPIAAGISTSEAYRAVTLQGVPPDQVDEATGLTLTAPVKLRLDIQQTAGGRIPLLVTGERADFVALTRSLRHRNEPAEIPGSMGGCMVSGLNNWDRIAALRDSWQQMNPMAGESEWQEEFARIVPQRELYQDRLIIFSDGNYSGVRASEMAMSDDEWRSVSLTIRRGHECAHYELLRLFGSMRTNVHEELIADYAGIVAAVGQFRAEWFLRFVGLENYPRYRRGGRLENYCEASTSPCEFASIQRIAHAAARNVEEADAQLTGEKRAKPHMLIALRSLGLAAIASRSGAAKVMERWQRVYDTAESLAPSLG